MRVGRLSVLGISDGTFVARPSYFGASNSPAPDPALFDRAGAAWLPIGCFLIRGQGRVILIDAGLGPEAKQLPDGMMLVGGQLLTGLFAAGVSPADIDTVICTHLHSDHVGWLFTLDAAPVFPAATIWVGDADLHAVLQGDLPSAVHIRRGLEAAAQTSRLRTMSGTVEIVPGITAYPTPGHTLGHYLIDVTSDGERLLIVGDAITCPIQLREPSWHSYGDVDADLGFVTRQGIWQQIRTESVSAVGSHFPGLRAGRVAPNGTEWVEDAVRPDAGSDRD